MLHIIRESWYNPKMNITLALVSSVNGRITRGKETGVTAWTSPEDQAHFLGLVSEHALIFMGKDTYEAAKGHIKLQEGKLRIVFTHTPETYEQQTVPGQLEFTSDSPSVRIAALEALGYTDALCVGGSGLARQFFQEKLITSLALTIEPTLFGSGTPLIQEGNMDISLQLTSYDKLNDRGTLLCIYRVMYE
jgi:dihydrofolate reductase